MLSSKRDFKKDINGVLRLHASKYDRVSYVLVLRLYVGAIL